MTVRWLVLALAILGLPSTVAAQIVADGEFVSWTFRSLVLLPPDETAVVSREPSGGNPGAHLRVAINLVGGEGRGMAIYEGFSTTAPLDGTPYSFKFDAKFVSAQVFVDQAVFLLVRQGNTIYEFPRDTIVAPFNAWAPFEYTGELDPNAFVRVLGSGPLHPIFSGGVATYFGLGGGNGSTGTTYDYDNFFLKLGGGTQLSEGFIDFETRLDSTPFQGPFVRLNGDEYLPINVSLRDSPFVPGEDPSEIILHNLAVSDIVLNETLISGFHLSAGASIHSDPSFIDLIFPEGTREIAFDWADPYGVLWVTAYDQADNPIAPQTELIGDRALDGRVVDEFGVVHIAHSSGGHAEFATGSTMYRVRVVAPSLPLIQGVILDNLRYEPAIPSTSVVAPDVRLGTGTTVGQQVIIKTGVVVGANTIISDLVVIERHATVGSHVILGIGSLLGRDVTVGDGSHVGEGSRVERGSSLGTDVLLGQQVAIEHDVSIGDGVQIGDRSEIGKGSIVAAGVRIGSDTSIGKSVQIGAGAVIGNNVTVRNGSTIPAGAFLPDGTTFP